jgi:hypothetical protein
MPDAHRRGPARALSLLAGIAAAGLLATAPAASAAIPGPQDEPGAFCTRSSCATNTAWSWSGPLGFAASALACIGLGRVRNGSPGLPLA